MTRILFTLAFLTSVAAAQEKGPPPRVVIPFDITAYAPPAKAVVAPARQPGERGDLTGYLGAAVRRGDGGVPVVEAIQPDSPADKAGIKVGDVVTRVGDQAVRTPLAFREWLQSHRPGETLKLTLSRGSSPVEVAAKLEATSRPMKPPVFRAYFGAEFEDKDGGVFIQSVAQQSPAAEKIRTGDQVLKVGGKAATAADGLRKLVGDLKPGDVLEFTLNREGKDMDVAVTVTEPRGRFGGAITMWRNPTMKVAIVPIEFNDTKHNPKVTPAELERHLLSTNYTGRDVTDQPVFGSLNDYVHEQSNGAFKLEGKAFAWVEVTKKRGDYIQGSGTSNKTAVLTDALDKLTARDGADALAKFDAVCFIYAGDRYRTNAGAVYYPHAGTVAYKRRPMKYFIGPEGGSKMTSVSELAKPLGLLLGLPDLAARTENIGSEGLGPWCALSVALGNGKPQHFNPWAKEKLGWLKPTTIDPTVKQKLVLSPIETSNECVKILVRPDGSEYFLLEVRKKTGFDVDLPGEGLLIWRVVNDRPILEEAHGIEGPAGPTAHLAAVPFPSAANALFTPDTTPSSRSPLGGGLPVSVTNIRKLYDGRVAFQVGYEYR
jgi:M6 family metalloprotease-like protein